MKNQFATASAPTLAPTFRVQTVTLYLGISLLRVHLSELLRDSVFAEDERLRANDSIYQTEDISRLQAWQRNVERVLHERQLAQAVANREQHGRTSDYAGELRASLAEDAFLAETGLSYADVLSL
ncbi:hypothetical protein [Hymenobacter defluvii]|uniref:Uncharacterized protein n=1 Tax=Hymenobacter defluvii TaxID=2054411 RepID=A0ABS3THR5_9BACT|nr:hypothetical protein [Hymenobacter defluvii]MBO3273196.1 hypothetical protein [Hymenobacter defluvii]